jgi:GH25 family lysozyme M1 (1,4-beta-N-acetylmuramidase)
MGIKLQCSGHVTQLCRLASATAVIATLATVGVVTNSSIVGGALPATGCPAASYPTGMDINSSSGSITWSDVECIDFVFGEATDGTSYVNPDFASERSGAQSESLPFGGYDLFEPNENSVAQADDFLSEFTVHPGDLPPILDLENVDGETAATIISGISSWISTVEAATGIVPILYTSNYFWTTTLGDPTQFSADPLWIADWNVSLPTLPDSNWGGNSWTLWQYSGSGTVTGVTNEVDLDYFNGDSATSLETSNASTVTIVSHSSDVIAGSNATVNVKVTGAFTGSSVPSPSGHVTVVDGSRSCLAALAGTGGTATGSCKISIADAGENQITASFHGDSNWRSSTTTTPTRVNVGKAASKVKLSLSASTLIISSEKSDRLSATVSFAGDFKGEFGTLTIKAGSHTLCDLKLDTTHGSCTLKSKELPVGTYTVQASFSGDANIQSSKSTKAKLVVKK